jgi:hypothetical protein
MKAAPVEFERLERLPNAIDRSDAAFDWEGKPLGTDMRYFEPFDTSLSERFSLPAGIESFSVLTVGGDGCRDGQRAALKVKAESS